MLRLWVEVLRHGSLMSCGGGWVRFAKSTTSAGWRFWLGGAWPSRSPQRCGPLGDARRVRRLAQSEALRFPGIRNPPSAELRSAPADGFGNAPTQQ
jgi:hypothetical protein